eukprot:TRINITY_DN5868_c0_g1_i1.p1 TRINITY_DN5868_c0_g1~~TRINITY_DN5868_c0_g1_i1.p1  ORF type:complete len:227 (+),score=13.64 TRINITY_DN5868_c0_g1_i1:68-748(+)
MRFCRFHLLLLIIVLNVTQLQGLTKPQDVQSLEIFFQQTNGPNWARKDNWLKGDPCLDRWHGVKCSADRVVYLSLWENRLQGTIPDVLGNLTSLGALSLSVNFLEGTLPESLGSLQSLRLLGLAANFLTGTIPSFLGNLKRLFYINLSQNRFQGNIPAALAQIPYLTWISLKDNKLTCFEPGLILAATLLNHTCFFGGNPFICNNTALCDWKNWHRRLNCGIPCKL